MDAGTQSVYGQLRNGNEYGADPLIADAEDLLAATDNNHVVIV